MAEAGKDKGQSIARVIQAVMGHAGIETTMDRYAEVTDARKKEETESLSHNLLQGYCKF